MGIIVELYADIKATLVLPTYLFKAVGNEIRSYNWYMKSPIQFPCEILPEYDVGERYVYMSDTSVFISGGMHTNKWIMNICFELNLESSEFSKKASMNQWKGAHGIIKFNSEIYVFGGYGGGQRLSTAERYSIDWNIWNPISDMPVSG